MTRAPPSAARPTANTTSPGSAASSAHASGGRVAGVDREHDEVAVGVDAGDLGLHGAAVGEGHLGGAVAQVVGVGEHEALADDDAAPAAGGASDAHDGAIGGGQGGAGRVPQGGGLVRGHGRPSGR